MTSYVVIAIVVGLLLLGVLFLSRILGEEEQCRGTSCTRHKSAGLPALLTSDTPVTLSRQEVEQGGLLSLIQEHASDPRQVTVDGIEGVEIKLTEVLNILTQKAIQHEQEIGDIVKVLPKKRTRKQPSPKKK